MNKINKNVDVLRFIELYRSHEVLWNMNLSSYRRNDLKLKAYELISAEMTMSVEEVKKKIKSLRTAYSAEKSKVERSKKSGCSTENMYMPTVFWYNEMAFLNTSIIRRATIDNSNQVGDNTLPNLMPLLAGYTKKTVKEKCNPNIVGGFDNCNFVWTTFKNNGFNTAYAEDTTFLSTFNYLMKGFKKPPTDYYFRPMALAIEKSLKRKSKSGLNYCLGRRQCGEYIYDFGMEFATRYKNLSSFGFFWTNSFSHNSYDTSATMDNTMVNYFKEFEKRGILENSVVIFFSDHGVRWGPLLKLSEGFLEERLPLFFMSVPNWFRQKYPELVKNLETNQMRLTSPFDIHMTLQHLLKLGQPTYEIQQALDCPNCQSIFKEIPENRTCDDACIPETWCTCKPFKQLSTKNELVKNITELIVKEINNYFHLRNLTSLCSSLKLDKITNAKIRFNDETSSSNNIDTYAIDFATKPLTKPKTLFSATVDYDVARKTIHLKVEDISRQSLYENTAKCTDDKQAKKYCICKNSLT